MGLNNLLGQARPEAGEQGFPQQNKCHKQWGPTWRKMQEGLALGKGNHFKTDQKVQFTLQL